MNKKAQIKKRPRIGYFNPLLHSDTFLWGPIFSVLGIAWSSLVEGDEGSGQSNGQNKGLGSS